MAEQLLTGQPTPPTGTLPLTYQNLFNEAAKQERRKDVPLPNGKYAANAKELELYLQTPENQEAFYKGYSRATMVFGPDVSSTVDYFKTKISGGLTSGEIAMQKAKPSLPFVKPVTQVQQMEYQDLNQPAIKQFNELKANKINKTASGKPLNSYTEMQDYFSSPENVSEWGKAYNSTIKYRKLDLAQVANNAKPKQSLKTITEIQADASEQIQQDDLGQVDPEKLAELVYDKEELGIDGGSIPLEKPIELTELVNGQLVTKQITELTYDNYTQLLKKKFGKTDVDTSLIEPSISGELTNGEPLVYDQTELGKELNKVKENYLDIKATKAQEENRSKIKNYNQDIETKMRQLLSPEEQQMAQVNEQIEALDDKMITDKFSGKGIPADYYAKRNTLEQQLTSMRGKAGLSTAKMFDSRTGQLVETTPEQKQLIQAGAQKAQSKITKSTPKEKLKAERDLLWEKVQLIDQQFASVKNEWESQNIPGSTAIGLAQKALGNAIGQEFDGGMTGRSAQLFNTMLNLENKKAEAYGQLLTYNSALATNEDVFQREKESSLKAAGESFLEDAYGFALFTDKNTVRTRMQEVEDIKNFYAKNGYELSNKQILSSQESLTTEVASGAGELLNLAIDIGLTSNLFKVGVGTLTGSKYWQATKELMSNKFGAYGRFATSMTEGALPYLTQGAAYGALGQNFATGVAESVTEKGFDKYAARAIEKFGGKYGKITFILGRWISGTLGEAAAETLGEISPLLLENGFDINAAYKQAFGETGDEQTKYFAKLGLTVAFMAAPANLSYVFKTKQKIQEYIANNGSNPVLEETMRVLDDTIERMPTGEAATRMDERIYGDNPVEPLVFVEAPPISVNEDVTEPPVEGPAERPQETVEVEKRSANNGEEFFVLENDGKVNKNVVYRVNETNGQLEVKGYDSMQEGFVPASTTITEAVDRKSKENGIISSDKATRVAKQRLNIDPDAERVITPEGKVLYQAPGQTAQQFGKNRQRNTNTVRATADNTFAFLNGLKEKIINNIFPNAETKIDDQQSASYNKYRDAVRAKMKLNAGSFFSKGKAVLMESGMNKIPKVADFLAALVEDFSKTGKTIDVAATAVTDVTTKVGLKIEDVVNSIISTEFFQDKFGSIAEASDYAKNLLTDLMINDKSVAQEIFGQNKEAYNQFIKFREGFNKYVAKNYTGKTQGYSNDHKFYNNQMPEMSRRAGEEEFQLEQSKQIELEQKRDDVANVLNLAGVETSTQNVEGVRYKQGEINAEQYLDILGEDINGLTSDEITAKAEVASEGVNLEKFNEAVANRTTNEQTRKKRESRLRKELRTKFGFNNPLAKLVAKGALPDMSMRSKRAVTATMMNKVIETAATRAGITADEFLDNYLSFEKATEQEFSDFVKNQPGGKELYQRIGELGTQYNQEVNQFLTNAKRFEKEGKTPEEILLATGWGKGVDGNWKYTLVAPSSNLNVSSLVNISPNQPKSLPLGAILDYPELYRAYPQLKQYEIIIENNPSSNTHGSFSGEIITINIANLPTLYQFNMVLQHELQHAVQRIEGWPGGGNPDNVYMGNPIDVLEAVAEKLRETGTPISDLAVKEADRLIRESGGQLVGASRRDFEALMDLIQQNLWDSFHPKFNEDLVNEFTQKFDMATSNQVINLLREVTNDSIYRSLYGEIEAENAVNQDYRAVNKALNAMMIDPDLLDKFSKPGKQELIKDLITQFNKVQSDYKAFVETAKLALAEVANNNSLTQLQKDILNGAFATTQNNEFGKLDKSKIDSVPFDIVKLYTELQKDPNIPTEALETILNVIKIRSDYANSSTKLKNEIVSNSIISSAILDSDMLMVETPLFYSQYASDKVVPAKKYNPEGYKTSQREWEAKRKQLDDASNAVQDFDPTGTKYQENQDNAFDDAYLLSDNENDWRDGEFTSLYAISNKRREEFINQLKKKRPDLEKDGLVDGILDEVEKFIDENTAPGKINPKLEKLTMFWVANGNVILPEDGYKIIEADRIATLKKIDPFTFKNPTELINKYQGEVKGKKITIDEIDKMPEFSNKTTLAPEFGKSDYTDKITVYTVEDTREGQEAVRKIIDSHFGEDANPWCLAARVNGNLDAGWGHWSRTYNAYPKKIAFKNGKLVAFSANSDSEVVWWDRNDEPQSGIKSSIDLGDNRQQEITINEDGSYEKGDIIKNTTLRDNEGNKIEIVETLDEFGTKKLLNRTKNGKLDGEQIEYLESGNIYTRESFKDGLKDGPTTDYYPDGSVNQEFNYKNGRKEGNQETYYRNGEIRTQQYYINGNKDGVQRAYYQNGNTDYEQSYKDGVLEGIQKKYYENGQPETEISLKNGIPDGISIKYSKSGQIQSDENFKNGKRDGIQKYYDNSGNLEYEFTYKNGKEDGHSKEYFGGTLTHETFFKDGSITKVIYYSEEGTVEQVFDYPVPERYATVNGNPLYQGNRGAAFITQDATDLIFALTDPNLSTPLHEIAHIYEKYMTDAEKKIVLAMTGETSWSTNTSEYFARGFERYLYSGNAPSAKFLQIFDKLRTWLKEIYTELTGSEIDVQLNQPMRDLYAAMLGQVEAPETQVTAEEGPKTADRELADFIQSKKDQGIPEEQIYTGLLQSGFKAADLEDFFNLKTRQTVASQIEEEGPMKDEARIAADEASGMYIRRTAEQLEMEMDSLTAEEAFTIIEHISQGNADVAISVAIQNILAKKALGENVQKEFDQLIEVGTNLGRALQAFTRLKNQSGALRARNIINKIEVKDKKKLPAVIKQKLIELGDKYDQAKLNFSNAKEAALTNPMGQSIISGKANIDYFQEKLKEFEKVGKEFSKVVAPYTSKTSITDTAMTIMRGNLLTPNSTVINITANTAKTIFNLPINLIASLNSIIASKAGGTKGSMRGWDYYTGAWKYKLRGFKKAAEILKEGNVPDTSKGLQLDTNFNGFRSLYEIVGSVYAKIIDKKTDEEIAAEYGYSLNAMGQIPKKEKLIKTIEGTFGFPAEVFFRILGAGDAVFRSTAYYSALTEQAKLAGLKDPKDIENFIILNSDYSNTKADNESLRFVYANNSRIYQGVSKIYGAGSDIPGKAWKLFATGVIPYAKIPTNVIIEFSEIMIPELSTAKAAYYSLELNKLAQKQKTTRNPQEKLRIEAEKQDLARKRDEMVGKAVVGTALTYTTAWIAQSGALSGGAQGEDRKRKDFQYRFERPYSINLSLLDRFVNEGDSSTEWKPTDNIKDYRFMGILGGMMFASEENRKEQAKSGKGQAVNQSVFSTIGDFFGDRVNNLGSTLAYLIDQSFLRGASQLFAVVNPTQEGAGERFLAGLLSTYSTVIIPNFAAIYDKANRKFIPEYDSPYESWDKIVYDFMAKVNERIPGNENTTPKIDAFGRPIPQTPVGRNPWLYNSIDVTKSSTGLYDNEDEGWEQLVYHAVKKGDIIAAIPPHPSPYIKTLLGGEKYRMSQEEYEKYSIAMGQARRKIVNRFIQTRSADRLLDLKSSMNSWPDGRPKTVDNEGHLLGYTVLGEILSSLYSAADATMINVERGIINEERKKMAIERPEEYQQLIDREKNNIYSNAIDLLYDNPNMTKYLPKTTAMDMFFTNRVKYEPDNKTYRATGDETQQNQPPVEQLTEEERLYMEYIKQRDKK